MVYRTLFFLSVLPKPCAQTTFIMLLTVIWPNRKLSWKRKNHASVPKVKSCRILLVDFKREILREWLGREKTLSFEAQNTKIFWWIRGNNNTDPYGRGQESDWPNSKKWYKRKTIINKLSRALNSLSKSLIFSL